MLTKEDLFNIKEEDLKKIFDELSKKSNLKLFNFNDLKSGKLIKYLQCSEEIESVNVSNKVETELDQELIKIIQYKDRYIYSLLDNIN